MKVMRDFNCPSCASVFERFTDKRVAQCQCGVMARDVPCAPSFRLEGVTGHFPTASDRWARNHEKAGRG